MNGIIKICFAGLLAIAITGCRNDRTEDGGHDHTHQEPAGDKAGHKHEEEARSMVTSLTEEQVSTVGITYGALEMKELTATVKANGVLRVPNNNKAHATSLYGGVVKSLQVQVGDHVRKGQVIAIIANPQFIQLQEEFLTIGSRITFAEQEQRRQQALNEGNAGARKNLQSATADLNALRARKASLQQQIAMMGISPASLSPADLKATLAVTSPISGTISNVFAKIGSFVDVSSPVAEIVDNGSLHLDLQVFEKDMPLIRVGQTIHFMLTNNPTQEYDAVVFNIGSAFENDSKTVPVHSRVKGNIGGLIDGMNITGIVSLSSARTPAVPDNAIVEADGKFYIFIRTDKEAADIHEEEAKMPQTERAGKAAVAMVNFEKIEVIKGTSDMGYTAITPVSSIPDGAEIVTKGAFFINARLDNTGGHEH